MPNFSTTINNIIFDLDGTLWDPMEMSVKAWHKALNGFNCITDPIPKEAIQGIMGMQHDLVGKKLFPYLSAQEQHEVMNSCYKQEVMDIKASGAMLYPGLEDTLKQLGKKYNLFIVSNCQAGYIEAFYEYHGLASHFKDFECSGNTGMSKGQNIKMLIERNAVDRPVYVGDTQGDYTAAMENHIPFIFAEYGFGEVPNAPHAISNITKLTDIL